MGRQTLNLRRARSRGGGAVRPEGDRLSPAERRRLRDELLDIVWTYQSPDHPYLRAPRIDEDALAASAIGTLLREF